MRGIVVTASAVVVLGSSSATAQDKPKEEQEAVIPASALPPEGMCRVWLKDVPQNRQPAATDCATAIRSRPRDALLLLGAPSKDAKLPPKQRGTTQGPPATAVRGMTPPAPTPGAVKAAEPHKAAVVVRPLPPPPHQQ